MCRGSELQKNAAAAASAKKLKREIGTYCILLIFASAYNNVLFIAINQIIGFDIIHTSE